MKQETFDAIRIIISWLGAFSFAYFMWYCYRNIDKNKTDIDKNKTDIDKNKTDIDNLIEHLGSCLKDLSVYSATTTRILVAYLNSFKLEENQAIIEKIAIALYESKIQHTELRKIGLQEPLVLMVEGIYHNIEVIKNEAKLNAFIPERTLKIAILMKVKALSSLTCKNKRNYKAG